MPYGYTAHMNTIAKMEMRGQEGKGRRAEARPTVAACGARHRGPSPERQPLGDRRTAVARGLAARPARRRNVDHLKFYEIQPVEPKLSSLGWKGFVLGLEA